MTDRHPDQFLQCQEAIADAFSDIALEVVRAGWNPEEVAPAMVELADHMMLGMIANRTSTQDLSILRRR